AQATLTYDRPVTALSVAPGKDLVLAAGHEDGGVTLHTIDVDRSRTTRQVLGGEGQVLAVSVSADASTLAALAQDGTLSVWDLRSDPALPTATDPAQPTGSASEAVAAGSSRVWLSATGDYAFIADTSGPPTLWSLAD